MVTKDNTPEKTEAPKGEHPEKGTVEEKPRVEFRKKAPDMEKYRKMVAEEEGVDPSQLDNEGNVNIRAMTTQGTQKEEKVEEPEGEKPEIPERYQGKTLEQMIQIAEEKEKMIQKQSGEVGEWKKKVAEAEEVRKKIAEIESQSFRQGQNITGLPEKPKRPKISEDDYYSDPVNAINKYNEYLEKMEAYNEQYINARLAPHEDERYRKFKKDLLEQLEEKYKDWPVKFNRKKVEEFLGNNPEYFTKYGFTNAYEKAYLDITAPSYSELSKKQKEEMREQMKNELLEEMNNKKQAGDIGMTDLQTQDLSGSSPGYDEERFEEDSEYRKKVLADIEKRRR
jgi:hypothetical protein